MILLLALLAQTLRPEEVVVVANRASAESMDVARHYLKRRGIPEAQLFEVDIPKSPRTISFERFEKDVAAPLRAFLEERGLKEKILCLVTVHDVPYVVSGPKVTDEERDEIARKNRIPSPNMVLTTRASLDSELAWLWRGDVQGLDPSDLKFRTAYCYQNRNPYFGRPETFRDFRRRAAEELKDFGTMYMTARLEGPGVEISRGLVDKAMQAEQEGPSGVGYFDSKGPTLGNRKAGYPEGEFWARRAWIETHNAGFKTVREETSALFGEGACPDALVYWGWYKLRDYQPSFGTFRPGAIAVHTASAEATDIRTPTEKGGPWCAGFLTHGAAATMGPVGEPFLNAFPHAEIFFPRLYEGWSLGDAYWNSHVELSWMMVLLGDPLYAPFAGANRRTRYVRGAVRFGEDGKARSGGAVPLALLLKAQAPIFKNPGAYKILDPGVNGPKLKLAGLDAPKAELREDGTLLVLTGPTLEAGDLGPFEPRKEKGPELEIHVDLGPDGGLKILSQLLAW